jgi:uncharacterized membrane protein
LTEPGESRRPTASVQRELLAPGPCIHKALEQLVAVTLDASHAFFFKKIIFLSFFYQKNHFFIILTSYKNHFYHFYYFHAEKLQAGQVSLRN